ncbi:sigma-70 family RNA polymerase sigma factor [Rhodocytophaga aerolata]|uniref:Sigma-70 family RNA polymerase sigma factor n=1 Tax=Rhodocytophaga aerolata TaxID=455078 RepID=A0ABT8REN1_9BACT|nr:sigma-70 family RNA polymerase sigma factor [Rhodocytophaga aerolata]MDO1450146.1 sigma-70 family RNA polymerase sigma factor [Rhodocytophaga aerolata]
MDKAETFIAALQANQGSIYKIASLYTHEAEDRDDLVQEIIYQLWKSFDSFNQQSKLSTWIYRVAMNVAIYHLKVTKRKVPIVPIDEQLSNLPDVDNSQDEEQWKLLKTFVDKLNLLDKGLVILYLEEKTYEEMAEIIGISVSNVATKLSRIKEKLKQQISKQA